MTSGIYPRNPEKHYSEERNKKVSEGLKRAYAEKRRNVDNVKKWAVKLGKMRKGVPHTEETKKLMSEVHKGEKAYNYKGGTGTQRHQEMRRLEYRNWRTAVFERDNYTCQICDQHGGTLHADHIENWADNIDLRYEVSNGRTLCIPCHYFITFKREMIPGTNWCGFTRGGE